MTATNNKRFGFADAVRKAVGEDSDNWEIHLYRKNNWDWQSGKVYMETRYSALGPEWKEFRHCVFLAKDSKLSRINQVRNEAGLSSIEAEREFKTCRR